MLMENQNYLDSVQPVANELQAKLIPDAGILRIIDTERSLEAVPVGNRLKLNTTQYGRYQQYPLRCS